MANDNVLYLARKIVKITDQELEQLEKEAMGQLAYISPLKHATQHKLNKLGAHNLETIRKLRDLRDHMLKGPEA